MEYNWALTGGAPLDAFEQWNQDMIANGNVPEGFDWKEHADFSCLTQVQENLGLEVAARRPLTTLTPCTTGAGPPPCGPAPVVRLGPVDGSQTQEGQLGGCRAGLHGTSSGPQGPSGSTEERWGVVTPPPSSHLESETQR